MLLLTLQGQMVILSYAFWAVDTDFIENWAQTARLNFQSSQSVRLLGHAAFQWLLIQFGFNSCSNWSFLELRRNQRWPWGTLPKYVKLWFCSQIHGKRLLFILWRQLFHWFNLRSSCWVRRNTFFTLATSPVRRSIHLVQENSLAAPLLFMQISLLLNQWFLKLVADFIISK